jgi:hypothetical protein
LKRKAGDQVAARQKMGFKKINTLEIFEANFVFL